MCSVPSTDLADSGAESVPFSDRVAALAVLLAAASIVWALLQVQPDGRGHGTHEQLGMQPCPWPIQYGIPCPTCGCTTAAAQLVSLSPVRAFVTQPFGAALALAGLVIAGVAAHALVTRRSFVEQVASWRYGTFAVAAIVLLLLSWGYKYWTWT